MPSSRSCLVASLALPFVLLACDGDGSTTSSAGGGGAGGSAGGAAGSAAGGSAGSTSTTDPTGGGGAGGAGGSGPTGTPMAYIGAEDGKIRVFSLDKVSGALSPVQEIDAGSNPSFLAFAPDRKALYAVDEGQDALRSFAIDGATGQLTPLNSAPCGGNGPAHVAVDATGKYVFGVNYGSGDLRMIGTAVDGSFGAGVTDLFTGANAHQIVLDAENRFAFVPNKGADTVSQLVFDAATGQLDFNQPSSVSLPAGSGPRHMAFHPSAPFAYIIHELDDKVTTFPFDAQNGTLGAPVQTVPTLPGGVDGGGNTCAEIAFGASGNYLYGSNRGHDSIVIYSVNPRSGMLTLVGHQPTGGQRPRHFSIEASGEILLVGNQNSDEVRTFRIDPGAGTLTELSVLSLPAGPAFVGVLYL
jgi:6-phosphogluconolactonase